MNHNLKSNGNDIDKGGRPLQSTNPLTANHARLIWLHYYNNYLLEHKVISPAEHRKMRRMIGEV